MDGIAFAGAAQTYAIGDVIGVDVTFNESVTLTSTSTAKPRIRLEIGSESVWAVWKPGQAAGAVHRFEYTVALNDLDIDGVAVKANSLVDASGQFHRHDVRQRGGLAPPPPGAGPGAEGGRGAPDRDRRVRSRADGDSDLVGGAGRGVGARGRRRVPDIASRGPAPLPRALCDGVPALWCARSWTDGTERSRPCGTNA